MRRRLILSFFLVAIVSITVVVLIARQYTASEVQSFMFRGSMVEVDDLVGALEKYYGLTGSWEGVGNLLMRGQQGMMHGMGGQAMMNQRLRLADSTGRLIVDSRDPTASGAISGLEREAGIPLTFRGRLIGILLVEGGIGRSGNEGRFLLNRLNRAALTAAVIAGGLALVLALLLSSRLIRPIQLLTQASTRLSDGDFSQRVQVHGKDELAALGQAFNQMANSLEQAKESRQALTADIAHELRTPLAVQRAHLEALQDGIYPLAPENLQPILEQNQLLTRLVEDLRTLALAEAGQLSLEKTPTDFAALVSRLVERFLPEAAARQVDLTFLPYESSKPAVPQVEIDPMRMEQILGNILTNALRHTPSGGTITIQLRSAAAALYLVVHNSGPDIPVEALPYIFERFYRADRSRSRSEGGSGLGLAIARQLAEAQGGALTAANHPSGGAVFTLKLPLSQESDQGAR